MQEALKNTFFARYGQFYLHEQTKAFSSFKNHIQFPILADVLFRQHRHHLILKFDFSSCFYIAFLKSFLNFIHTQPHPLQSFTLLDLQGENLLHLPHDVLDQDIDHLCAVLDHANHMLLIAMPYTKDAHLSYSLKRLLHHPKCRLIMLTHDPVHKNDETMHFNMISINPFLKADAFILLKEHCKTLEAFHHVLIPDDLLSLTYTYTERYLSIEHTLEKTLELLDSSAAFVHTLDKKNDLEPPHRPMLTEAIILQVLARWTEIPVSHLRLTSLKQQELLHGMQQRLFGQQGALHLIYQKLQQAETKLQKQPGPFCSFLFAGPHHTGKKTTAILLTEQLFKQINKLYVATLSENTPSLLNTKVECYQNQQRHVLKDIISHIPHAVFFFENSELASPIFLQELHEVLHTGHCRDIHGHDYHFQQAIIILSTTLGSSRLIELNPSFSEQDDLHHLDLMQLIMNEQKHTKHHHFHDSPQDIVDEILPEISGQFPLIHSALTVIPFLPLHKNAIENIVRIKLKTCGKQLHMQYHIELGYAPEVMRFLTHDILKKQDIEKYPVDIDKALTPLYTCIEQAVFNQLDNKNRPNQLFLQLNENGQGLRVEWLKEVEELTNYKAS